LSKKIIVLVTLLTLLAFTVTGCGLLDKLLSIKEDFNNEEEKPKEQAKEEMEKQVGEIKVETPEVKDPVITQEPVEQVTVQLFFGAPDGQHLVAVEENIPKVIGIAREAINELLEGPDFQSGLLPTIPAGTKLLDINVKDDGLCIVDFSKELIANMSGGELNEKLAVYSITNTLCQFPTVDRVEFRVEGQKIDTLLGYTQLEPTVAANADIIQEIK